MRNALRFAVPAFVLVTGAALAQDSEKVQLAPHFVKGATADFEQAVSSAQSFTMGGGMAMQQDSSLNRAWTQTVESVADDGGATVQIKFGRIHGNATSMMGTMEFDSANPDAAGDPSNPMGAMMGQMSKAFTVLSGKTATVKVGKDGSPGEVKGLEGAVAEASGGGGGGMGGPGGMGGGMGGATKQLAKTFSSPEAVQSWLRMALPKLPEKPVGVGDTWDESWTQEFAAGRKLTVTVTYKVTSVDTESVGVVVNGKFDLAAAPATGTTPPAGKEGEKPATPPMPPMPPMPGGAGGAGGGGRGMGGAPGAPGAPGGRGGMGAALEDAQLEKSSMTGTGKVSRKDGMILVSDSAMTLALKSPSSGVSMEQSSKSHLERKAATSTPSAPAPAPATPPMPPVPPMPPMPGGK